MRFPDIGVMRFLGLAAAALLAVYVVLAAGLYIFQDRLLYFPSRVHASPAALGFAGVVQDQILAEDNEKLVVWRARPAAGRPTIIFFHGNEGGLRDTQPVLEKFTALGLGVIAGDWRGYGASTGKPSEEGLKRDARAIYRYARAVGVKPEEMVVVGQSLGAGIALWLASQEPVAAVVVDAPYSSIADVAAQTYWMFPARWIIRDRFDATEWIGAVQAPILGLAAERDPILPLPFAQKLFAAGNPEKAKLLVYAGAAHGLLLHEDAFVAARDFILAAYPPNLGLK